MPGLPKHDHQALPDHRTDVGGDAVFIRDGGNCDALLLGDESGPILCYNLVQ